MDYGAVAGAAFYSGVGIAALVRPALVPAIFGGTAPTASSRTEIRAVYGGLPLAMAGLIVAEARGRARQGTPTEAVAALSAAMAVGRVVGSLLEREADGVTRFFIAVEAATAAALVVGRRSRRTQVHEPDADIGRGFPR